MTIVHILQIGREMMLTTMFLALPAVAVSLLVGLGVSIVQTVTSIQEQTLSFAPRIIAVGIVIVIALPWMLKILISFAYRMIVYPVEAGL